MMGNQAFANLDTGVKVDGVRWCAMKFAAVVKGVSVVVEYTVGGTWSWRIVTMGYGDAAGACETIEDAQRAVVAAAEAAVAAREAAK